MILQTTTYEQYLEKMSKLAQNLEKGVERVESYELLDEGLRLWNLIKNGLLRAAKDSNLSRNHLVEIVKTGQDSLTVFINRSKAREVRVFKMKKNINFYNLMLRIAILAEPYGLKVISTSASSIDEHWVIEFVK